jgi:hypothetical protein
MTTTGALLGETLVLPVTNPLLVPAAVKSWLIADCNPARAESSAWSTFFALFAVNRSMDVL